MSALLEFAAANLVTIGVATVAVVLLYRYLVPSSSSGSRTARGPASVTASHTFEEAVGSVNDLKEGEMKEVKLVAGGSILLSRVGGVYRATGHKCTHLQAPLSKVRQRGLKGGASV